MDLIATVHLARECILIPIRSFRERRPAGRFPAADATQPAFRGIARSQNHNSCGSDAFLGGLS